MADKQKALYTFKQNEALLVQIVGLDLYCEAFADFLPSLGHMTGECLCMDPVEVTQGDEDDFLHSGEPLNSSATKRCQRKRYEKL